jgi:hypothetical protein
MIPCAIGRAIEEKIDPVAQLASAVSLVDDRLGELVRACDSLLARLDARDKLSLGVDRGGDRRGRVAGAAFDV